MRGSSAGDDVVSAAGAGVGVGAAGVGAADAGAADAGAGVAGSGYGAGSEAAGSGVDAGDGHSGRSKGKRTRWVKRVDDATRHRMRST